MTKDHLIYIVSCNKARDELWCGGKENNIIKTTNAIGFLFGGTANSFFRDKQGAWNSHASLTSPVAQVRQNFSNFGMVSASNCSSFGAIVERENSFVAGDGNDIQLGAITSKNEKKKIQTSNETIYMGPKCKTYQQRDLYTFDEIPIEQVDINMILDSEIEMILGED
jgi:hypothetical protein